MSKPDKKSAASQAKRLQQLKRQQQQKAMKLQLQKIKEQQEKLRKTSSPLVQYGLLDAYQFFLKYLGQNGIPQPNIFQFAAQAVLKYEKKMKKKQEQLKRIQQYNKSVIQSQKKLQNSAPVKKKIIKPNMLPFKGQIGKDELSILNKLQNNKKTRQKVNSQELYEQQDN